VADLDLLCEVGMASHYGRAWGHIRERLLSSGIKPVLIDKIDYWPLPIDVKPCKAGCPSCLITKQIKNNI